MALFALRDIEPGEELTYDYNFALFNPSEGQQCRCGSSACRGVIGKSVEEKKIEHSSHKVNVPTDIQRRPRLLNSCKNTQYLMI